MSLQFLLNEYQRATLDYNTSKAVSLKLRARNDELWRILHRHQHKMEDKKAVIVHIMNEYCRLLEIEEENIDEKIHQLKKNEPRLKALKKTQMKMKSKIQSYDIRDCEQY